MPTPDELLLDALDELAPATVLAVGARASSAAARYGERHPERETVCVPAYPEEPLPEAARRFRLGVIAGPLGIEAAELRALIARLRDQSCETLLLLVPEGQWPLAEYLALGFERRAECEACGRRYVLYWYDVDRYNPEREWNNPANWAHPENFKRFRW
jgi:hypothetical protein